MTVRGRRQPRRGGLAGMRCGNSAARRLNRLDAKMRERIRAKVAQIAEDPAAPNRNLDHLTGMDGYRLRVGG